MHCHNPSTRAGRSSICDGTRPACGRCERQAKESCDYIPSDHNILLFSTLVSILPPSLERLHLWACDASIFEQIRELVIVRIELVPNLKEIYIEMDSHWEHSAREEFQVAYEILQEEGIEFSYGLPRLPSRI